VNDADPCVLWVEKNGRPAKWALLGQLVYLARTPIAGRMRQNRPAIDRYRARMKESFVAEPANSSQSFWLSG
jgi:hypothetical protein